MQQVLAICLGACVGALARWKLGLWLSHPGSLPWGTLAANAVGGYLIGLCVAFFQNHAELDPVWQLALVTGFLGALTTFSSFSAEVVALLQQGRWAVAASWAVLQLCVSLALTVAGIATLNGWRAVA